MHTTRIATVASVVALVLGAAVGCAKEDSSPAADTPSTKMRMAPAQPETAQQPPAAQQRQATNQPPGANMQSPGQGGPTMDQMRESCPMLVSNAKVEVTDTDRGVALTFTTDEGNVADLRGRVQHMAQMYQMHHGHGSMMWHQMRGQGAGQGQGMMGQGQGHMMGQGQGRMMGQGQGQGMMAGSGPMPAVQTSVQNVDKGAKLVLTPEKPTDLASLRNHVRMHQERMNSGECWMLQNQGPSDSKESE